jgi:DNA anti-recombination protein RmuC
MNTDERALVIILSVTLAIFLILSIIALIKTIQILNRIKSITEKAEEFADKAEAVGDFFQKTAGPATLVKSLSHIARMFKQNNKTKGE